MSENFIELTEEEVKKLNLYQKIHYAIALLQFKNIEAPVKSKIGSGDYGYKAFLAESIISAGNEAFYKARLVLNTIDATNNIINYEVKNSKGQVSLRNETHLIVKFKLVNIDALTEYEIITIPAMGQDNGDKAVNKALTYAQKYAFMHILKLQDAFDGEMEISKSVEKPTKQKQAESIELSQEYPLLSSQTRLNDLLLTLQSIELSQECQDLIKQINTADLQKLRELPAKIKTDITDENEKNTLRKTYAKRESELKKMEENETNKM